MSSVRLLVFVAFCAVCAGCAFQPSAVHAVKMNGDVVMVSEGATASLTWFERLHITRAKAARVCAKFSDQPTAKHLYSYRKPRRAGTVVAQYEVFRCVAADFPPD